MNLCLYTANRYICNLHIEQEFAFANAVISHDNLRFQTIQMQTVVVSMSTTPLSLLKRYKVSTTLPLFYFEDS